MQTHIRQHQGKRIGPLIAPPTSSTVYLVHHTSSSLTLLCLPSLPLGMSNPNIFRHIVNSFGPAAYSRSTVNRWAHRFCQGVTTVRSRPRSGRPPRLTPVKVAQIQGLLQADKTLTIRQLARQVNLSLGSVHKAVRKILQLRKRPAKWVAHLLTAAQKQTRLAVCHQNLALVRRRVNLMSSIVSGDKSWIFSNDPASKQATSVWLSPGEVHPQKVQLERATIKVMLVLFFDAQGIILKRYMPYGRGINADLYLTIMRQLHNTVCRCQPQMWATNSWLLHHDGTPAHRSARMQNYLRNTNTQILGHPPYLPDLAPADFWIFQHIKCHLKGQCFQDIPEVIEQVNAVIGAIQPDEFHRAFARMAFCWRSCLLACGVLSDFGWKQTTDYLAESPASSIWIRPRTIHFCQLD